MCVLSRPVLLLKCQPSSEQMGSLHVHVHVFSLMSAYIFIVAAAPANTPGSDKIHDLSVEVIERSMPVVAEYHQWTIIYRHCYM